MSDFLKELEAKAYALVSDEITLDLFKAWYQGAAAKRAQPEAKRKDGEFSDYYQRPYEPIDSDMREHHRKLMGEGEQEQ